MRKLVAEEVVALDVCDKSLVESRNSLAEMCSRICLAEKWKIKPLSLDGS